VSIPGSVPGEAGVTVQFNPDGLCLRRPSSDEASAPSGYGSVVANDGDSGSIGFCFPYSNATSSVLYQSVPHCASVLAAASEQLQVLNGRGISAAVMTALVSGVLIIVLAAASGAHLISSSPERPRRRACAGGAMLAAFLMFVVNLTSGSVAAAGMSPIGETQPQA